MEEPELLALAKAYHNGQVTKSAEAYSRKVIALLKAEDWAALDKLLGLHKNEEIPMAFHYVIMLATSQNRTKLKNREAYTAWFVKWSNRATIAE